MPRRLLNSKIWTNEKVGSLPFGGRLLFIALITHADDDGRLKGSPRYLKALCFPYDDIEIDDVSLWLNMLSALGLVQPYSVNGNVFLCLTGWNEHQSIRKDRYAPSTLPSPTDNQLTTKEQPTDNQLTTTVPLNISKDNIIESNIIKGVVKGENPPKPPHSLRGKNKMKFEGVVFLTPEEHEKLTQEFGETGVGERIKALALYIQSTGKKYKSHYATILNWERMKKTKSPKLGPAGRAFFGEGEK